MVVAAVLALSVVTHPALLVATEAPALLLLSLGQASHELAAALALAELAAVALAGLAAVVTVPKMPRQMLQLEVPIQAAAVVVVTAPQTRLHPLRAAPALSSCQFPKPTRQLFRVA